MKKAVAYTRFSSENQNDVSIEAQMRAIKEYAVKNDYEIVKQYIDRAKSASSDKRPEFQKMVKESKSGDFEAVIIHKIDRFARNMKDAAWYKAELNQFNVDLLSVNEDLTGESGDLVFNIMASVADWYLKNLRNEIDTKVRITAEKGYFLGGIPPFGFDTTDTYEEMKYGDRIKKIKRKKYVINEEEAKIIEMIFKYAAEGNSTLRICSILNNNNVKNRSGKEWNSSSIYDILHNPKYKGTYVYARGNHRTSHIKRDDAVVIPNAIPSIVSEELWEKAQAEMKKRKRERKGKNDYLLKNLIYCGKCGAKMVPDGGNYSRYVCGFWKKAQYSSEKSDHFISINKNKVESYVVDKIYNEITQVINYNDIAEKINKYYYMIYDYEKKQIDDKKKQFDQLKIKKKRLEVAYLEAIENGVSIKDYQNRIKEINNKIKIISNQLYNSHELESKITENDVRDMVTKSTNILLNGSIDEKIEYIKNIVEKVIIKKSISGTNYIEVKLKGLSGIISKFQ